MSSAPPSRPDVITAVKGIVIYKDEVLLLKEKVEGGYVWDLPGGKIDYKEDPKNTLTREMQEELGITVVPGKVIGVWYFFTKDTQNQIVCITYLCPIDRLISVDLEKNPSKTEKIMSYEWVSLTKVCAYNSAFKIEPSLRDIFYQLLQKGEQKI